MKLRILIRSTVDGKDEFLHCVENAKSARICAAAQRKYPFVKDRKYHMVELEEIKRVKV